MGKKNRNRTPFHSDGFWQSANYNARSWDKYMSMLVAFMLNRFKWEGLPETCDARFLEWALLRYGTATICRMDGESPWQTLIALPEARFNAYGIPVKWRAMGYLNDAGEGETQYNVTPVNGELVYYSQSRLQPWSAIEMFARKLAHYDRTEDINLSHQHKPWVFIAPQEKKLELTNLLKQVDGGEPAVMGDRSFGEMVDSVKAIDTGVPLIVEDLARGKQNVWNEFFMFAGIPHLAFEKGERMIEDEARANSAPTQISLLNCIEARRAACEAVNRRFGLNVQVYFNEDLISLNHNYTGNLEAMAQDGLIGGEAL